MTAPLGPLARPTRPSRSARPPEGPSDASWVGRPVRTLVLAACLLLSFASPAQGRTQAPTDSAAPAPVRADTLPAGDTKTAADARDSTDARSGTGDGVYDRPFVARAEAAGARAAVGGYAEGVAGYFRDAGVPEPFSMELRRFNLFLFSALSPRIRFLSELEFEHGTEEITLETALLDVEVSPSLVLRGGIVLPPVGYFNQNHDGPRWNLVDRPLVSTELVPSTLSEVGFGAHGELFPGELVVSYDLYLTNGLDEGVLLNERGRTHLPSGKSERQFAADANGSPAVSARLALARPAGGELGVSVYTARYNVDTEEGDRVDDPRRLTLWALDAGGELGPVQVRTEWALATVEVPPDLSELAGDRQWGAHLDLGLPIWRPDVAGWDDAVVALDLRLEHVDWNVGRFRDTGRSIGDEVTAVVPGISFRPVPGTVVRLNHRREWWRDFLANPREPRAGWQIGVATYF